LNSIAYHLLLARNVINTDEVEKYIKDILPKVNSKIGKTWISSNLKNYIFKKMDAKEVKNYKAASKDSTHIQKAVQYNESIYKINLNHSFKTEVNHVIDHINGLEPLQLKKIIQKPFPILNTQAKEATRQASNRLKKKFEKDAVVDGLKLIKKYGSASLVQLISWKQFEYETAILDHCIGQKNQKNNFFAKSKRGLGQYYSLRVKGKPVGTIEVYKGNLLQIKGYQDGEIELKYHSIFRNILDKKIIKYKSADTEDYINIGLVLIDDKQYDLYNLPKGLTTKGDINLSLSGIEKLNGLTCNNLDLEGSNILHLSDIKCISIDLDDTILKSIYNLTCTFCTDFYEVPIESIQKVYVKSPTAALNFDLLKSLKRLSDIKCHTINIVECNIKQISNIQTNVLRIKFNENLTILSNIQTNMLDISEMDLYHVWRLELISVRVKDIILANKAHRSALKKYENLYYIEYS
jgi:hypothetical protein